MFVMAEPKREPRLRTYSSCPGEATKLCFAPMSRVSTSFFRAPSPSVDVLDEARP